MAQDTGVVDAAATDGDEAEYRVERDTMGEIRVPKDAKYQAQTQRAIENFPISLRPLERAQIRALALIKSAAAEVNRDLGVVPDDVADAIVASAVRVAEGEFDDHFPLDVFQTGSGTSSNMNTNEVLGTLATERLGAKVHPNDHVNASQSSNDVFSSSIHVAATEAVERELIPALEHLAAALSEKAAQWAMVVKSGRTHLMDATPVTLGQEFGGYAAQMTLGVERLRSTLPRLAELPLGGTAVGTGINTPPGFAAAVIARLSETLQLPFTEARNHFEAQGSRDALGVEDALVGLLALPSYAPSYNDRNYMPKDIPANVGYAAADRHFPQARMNPEMLLIETDHDVRNSADMLVVDRIAKSIFHIPGVGRVQAITRPEE